MLPLAAAGAHAQIFGDATNYNVFTIGNFSSTYSDTEGKMAIGGNASLTGYDIGMMDQGGNALVVGGSLNMFQGTVRGNAVVGGTRSVSNVTFQGGSLQAGSPINFSTAKTFLESLSTQWKGFGATGTASRPYSSLELRGTRSGVNIFRVNASDLTGSSDVKIYVPNGSQALIQVFGTGTLTMPNFGINFNDSQDPNLFKNVVWHLPDITTLNVNSMRGTVFAPRTDISGSWGAIDGQLIAKSFSGPTQINWQKYQGTRPVPEPFTMGLLGAAGAAWIARRRRTAKAK